MNILVTGASSGLGRWLASIAFAGAHTFNRTSSQPNQLIPSGGYDLIIHTAQGAKPAKGQTDEAFIEAHVKLAQTLLEIPHRRFIYLSSIDALPSNPSPNAYAYSKQAVEKELASSQTATVLRPAALFGSGMRPNTVVRMVTQPHVPLTLSAASTFSFASYEDIAQAIKQADSLPPVFTLGSLPPYSLSELAEILQISPRFGNFTYTTPLFHLKEEVLQAIPELSYSALERLKTFIVKKSYLT